MPRMPSDAGQRRAVAPHSAPHIQRNAVIPLHFQPYKSDLKSVVPKRTRRFDRPPPDGAPIVGRITIGTYSGATDGDSTRWIEAFE